MVPGPGSLEHNSGQLLSTVVDTFRKPLLPWKADWLGRVAETVRAAEQPKQ